MRFIFKITVVAIFLLPFLRVFAESASSVFDDENYIIVDVGFKRQMVGEGIEIYATRDDFYFPLVDLVALLELNIEVNAGDAKGIAGDGVSQFQLVSMKDASWQVTSEDKVVNLPEGDILTFDDRIYINQRLAKEWFGATMELDFSESAISLTLSKPTPLEARIARQNRSSPSQSYIEDAKSPVLEQPYEWAEVPSLDFRLGYIATRYDDNKIQANRATYYSGRSVGDLLAMSTETFFSGNRDDGLKSASVRMDRFDNSRNLLGPLRLSQVSVGDITHPTVGGAGSYGRGVMIGNDINQGGRSRDIRDIEGDFYPGWEVELYLGTTLVGYQVIDDTGHYKFTSVVLFEGVNRFSLKFFGPNGQTEEQSREVVVGDDPKNNVPVRFSLSISQPNTRVIDLQDDNEKASLQNNYQVVLTSRVRLSDAINMTFGAQETKVPVLDSELVTAVPDGHSEAFELNRYYNFGLQTYFKGMSLGLNSSMQDGNTTDYSITASGGLAGASIYFSAIAYEDVTSESQASLSEDYNPINATYNLALNKSFGRSLSFVYQGIHTDYQYSSQQDMSVGVSSALGWLGLSTILDYSKTDILEGINVVDTEKLLTGSTYLGASMRDFSVRIAGVYSIVPESELTSLNASAAIRLEENTNLDIAINHNFFDSSTSYGLGLSWVTDYFRLSPSVNYYDTGRWQGLIQFSTSLGKRTGRVGNYYKLGSDPTLTRGSVKATLFEDANDDGLYQVGESLLSGGEINAVQLRRKARSNKAGVVWLESIKPWQRTDIAVDENTINEGYMALTRDDFSLVPRPGRVTNVELPFVRVGEIDGSVMMTDSEFTIPAPGVLVQLINSAGEVIDERRTDSSGYFDFPRIKPSSYSFKVKDKAIIKSVPENIEILRSGNYESGVQIFIDMPEFNKDEPSLMKLNVPDETAIPPSPVVLEHVIDVPADDAIADNKTSSVINGEEAPSLIADDELLTFVDDAEIPVVSTLKNTQPSTSANKALPIISSLPSLIDTTTNNPPVIEVPTNADKSNAHWRLQAGSFSSEIIAQRFIAQANDKGMISLMEPVVVKGVNYYRVYLGAFTSRSEALAAKTNIDATLKIQSIAVKPNVESAPKNIGQL